MTKFSRRSLLFLYLLLSSATLLAQKQVQLKNYPFLTIIQKNKEARKILEKNPVLNEPGNKTTHALKLSDTQISKASTALLKLFPQDLLTLLASQLRTCGAYSMYDQLKDKELLIKALELECTGINHTISVYAEGAAPNYPSIDSISFNLKDPEQKARIEAVTNQLLKTQKKAAPFYQLPLQAALAYLELNGRNDAGQYEPMEKTVNRKAVKNIQHINWSKYPYTLILVPGEGPEDTARLTDVARQRCKLALDQYNQGLAPFIVLSGGKVHPFKTPYCEAEEMKRYLVAELKVPEKAIILEPHARHTTTNLRNTARLIYRYKIPSDKPALVTSDELQSSYISKMEGRCIRELGNVPYKLGKRLSSTSQEFYPVWTAMQVNTTEPLDP